jgi:hypothetical protein
MKDIWQHTSGTMYTRWIKFGWMGGTKIVDAKNRACPAREICQQLHVTETDHCHWSVAIFFLRLNIKCILFEL